MAFFFNQGDRPLAGYTIQRGVGRGAFGEVYYATSDGGKEVALKYLRDNPQIELRGVSHCLNLKSPYLVDLYDIKQNADGDHFVVMEYVSGVSLRDLLNNEPQGLGPQKAAYFLRELCKGLSHLHDRGIVHRDLKPGNIFYEDGYVKIGDYGLAKMMATSQHSGQTMSIGTVHYMAPEIGSGNYDRTIDIYALGVILYEMLLGRVPFSGATMGEVLMKHLTAQPEVDDLPEPFPAVIRKALAKDPKERYQTANEMMEAVFEVEDIHRSVASLDSLSLTRMAAAVSRKVRVGGAVHAGGGYGAGSSHVPGLGESPVPPPVMGAGVDRGAGVWPQGDRGAGARMGQGLPPVPEATARGPHSWSGRRGRRRSSSFFPRRYRRTTGILGVLLGPLGVHRFYTGYLGIGILQIIVTFMTSGIAGLWGFIEGVRILSGFQFKDALGRPLLEADEDEDGFYAPREEQETPSTAAVRMKRNAVDRGVWGFFALLSSLGALGMTIGAILSAGEYEQIQVGASPGYWVNWMDLLFVGASLPLGWACLCLWKASHRGGLSFWRRTARPVILSILVTVMVGALALELCFLVGVGQAIAQCVIMGAAALFVLFWTMRGPDLEPRAGDAYWHRAWDRLFTLLCLGLIVGGIWVYRGWQRGGGDWQRDTSVLKTIEVRQYVYDYDERRMVGKDRTFEVPSWKYDHAPLALGLMGLTLIGAMSERRVRWRQARTAEQAEQNREPQT